MGILLSRFRKKKSTKDVLQKLQEEIESLEEYQKQTENKRRQIVLKFVALCVTLYISLGILGYFYQLPPSWEERLIYLAFFIGSIIVVYLLKSLLTCYFLFKVRRNEKKLQLLKNKKDEMLDQVMETETYKIAKDILETFAPEQFRKTTKSPTSILSTASVAKSQKMLTSAQITPGFEVRRRIISPQASRTYAYNAASPMLGNTALKAPQFVLSASSPQLRKQGDEPQIDNNKNLAIMKKTPYGAAALTPKPYSTLTPVPWRSTTNVAGTPLPNGQTPSASNQYFDYPPGPPMPRPILPRERGVMDRFIEYLVGEGPSNRYALICRQCESHNGMALQAEFEYLSFRCAYCAYWNPARKQRPPPPKLDTEIISAAVFDRDALYSDSDDDELIENIIKETEMDEKQSRSQNASKNENSSDSIHDRENTTSKKDVEQCISTAGTDICQKDNKNTDICQNDEINTDNCTDICQKNNIIIDKSSDICRKNSLSTVKNADKCQDGINTVITEINQKEGINSVNITDIDVSLSRNESSGSTIVSSSADTNISTYSNNIENSEKSHDMAKKSNDSDCEVEK